MAWHNNSGLEAKQTLPQKPGTAQTTDGKSKARRDFQFWAWNASEPRNLSPLPLEELIAAVIWGRIKIHRGSANGWEAKPTAKPL